MSAISLLLFKNEQFIPISIVIILFLFICFILYQFPFIKSKPTLFSSLVITGCYAIISLWQLGSSQMPETWWQPSTENNNIILHVNATSPMISKIYLLGGEGDNNALAASREYQLGLDNLLIEGSNDMLQWQTISHIDTSSYLQWKLIDCNASYQYIKVTSSTLLNVVNEIGVLGYDNKTFYPLSIINSVPNRFPMEHIIDEQHKIPLNPTYMDETYFDEIYHVRNAWEIANGQSMYASVHPLLGTSIIALGIKLFGNNPFAWRIMGALFGILMLPLFHSLIQKMFKSNYISIVATTLFAADFMHITTSRIATLEPFSIFFILLMFHQMYLFIDCNHATTSLKKQYTYLLTSGIAMGLAIAVKWTGCYGGVGLAICFFYSLYTQRKNFSTIKLWYQFIIKTCLFCLLSFIILPLLIYAYSFYFTKVWWNEPFSISKVISHSISMYDYHSKLNATHPYSSNWYQWLFDIRPIWYFYRSLTETSAKSISCFNNPLISWIGVITIIMTIIHMKKKITNQNILIIIGYLSSLLPWVLVSRCVFSYHYYPAYPFLIMTIAYIANELIQQNNQRKKLITLVTIICVVVFLFYLPVTCGFTTYKSMLSGIYRLLPSWYFG